MLYKTAAHSLFGRLSWNLSYCHRNMPAIKSFVRGCLLWSQLVGLASCHWKYEDFVHFTFYDVHSEPAFTSNHSLPNGSINCASTDKVAIIVHGWHEGCFTQWVPLLVQKLTFHRGGCIVCMDYSDFARYSYYSLVGNFDGIAEVLANQLRLFRQALFDPARIFMFGFSFGGQLVLEAGRRLGVQELHQIDACEPAGPGFDRNATFQRHSRPTDAARNVQCIHTSYDKGTAKRSCHQNWNMGRCGWTQAAAGAPPLGSHGLCPYMYVSAFENRFAAVAPAAECTASHEQTANMAEVLSNGYYMGYDENRTSAITGELYANSYKNSPFNVPSHADMYPL